MRTSARLAVYGLALAGVFAAGFGLGAAVGPGASDEPVHQTPAGGEPGEAEGGHGRR